MLPFMQKKEGSVSHEPEVLKRPENTREVTASLELAMKELFSAQDDKSRALAFKAAFELLEVSSQEENT